MNLKFRLIAFLLVTLVFNCKNTSKNKTLDTYKFSDKGIVVNCDNFDVKLLNEALFSFEADLLKDYEKNRKSSTANLSRAYTQFISNAIYGRVKYADVLSPQSVKIFEVLKSKNNLWDTTNPKSKLNYNDPLISCISNNILDNDLKTTFNALIETNSMSAKLFGPAIQSNYSAASKDKYLSTYIALEFFYGKLFDVDLSKVSEKPEPPVDFNKIPAQTPQNDPHAGHNH